MGYLLKDVRERKVYKTTVIKIFFIINLSILGVFKYGIFLIDSIYEVPKVFHITTNSWHFDLLLSVGISFYTFQAFGYIIDVYRNDVKVEKLCQIRFACLIFFAVGCRTD